ncbi:MAG TPA: 2-phospho-L-lactate guanylyltransferase [Solirubrobacterales bacterium]|nr:2-phospho-L-lactate guanylyltransferase [Solirubrobacterales bacterium]
MKATAVLPVKRFARAKTRVVETIGPPGRAAVLRAMLADVLVALEGATEIERVIVVTGEGRAEKIAMERAKRGRTPLEVLRDPTDHGHSEAATLGIIRAKALGAECAALLPGDCPLLDPAELDAAIAGLGERSVGVATDRHGTGTNGLFLSPADAIGPAFGPDSRERHLDRARRAGYEARDLDIPSLALDLDTPEDLDTLAALLAEAPERAPLTAVALAEL